MANNVEEIYIKMSVDTRQFDGSMQAIKREMATLRGLVGNSLLSSSDQQAVTKRLGELKNRLDDIRASANNIDVGDVFGNMAKFGSVAANAVAGVTGAMSLLGVESSKTGEIEKKILQFMAIGNALQAVADSKRLRTLAEIYGQKVKDLFITKQISEVESNIAQSANIGGGTTNIQTNISETSSQQKQVEVTDTSNIAKANTAANLTQAASMNTLTASVEKNTLAMNANGQVVMAASEKTVALNAAVQAQIPIQKAATASFEASTVAYKQGTITQQEYLLAQQTYMKTSQESIALNNALRVSVEADTAAKMKNLNAELVGLGLKAKSALIMGRLLQMVGLNTLAESAYSKAKLAGASADVVMMVANRGLTASIWAMTAALLANPLVWFAATIAVVAAALWGLYKVFTADERAVKSLNERMKETNEYLHELQKQTKLTADEVNKLTDDLLVQQGKMAESTAKKRDLQRKYNEELIEGDKRVNKQLDDLGKMQNRTFEGYLFDRKKILSDYNKWVAEKNEKLALEIQLIQEEDAKKKSEMAKEAYNKAKEAKEKEFQDELKLWEAQTQAHIAEMEKDWAKRKEIQEREDAEMSTLIESDPYGESIKKAQDKRIANALDGERKLYDFLRDYALNELKYSKDINENKLTSQSDYLKRKLIIMRNEQDYNKLIGKEDLQLDKEYYDTKTQLAQLQISNTLNYAQMGLQTFSDFTNIVLNTQMDAMNTMVENQIKALEDALSATMSDLDRQLKYGIISQEVYNRKKIAAEEELASKEKVLKTEQAKKQKEYNIWQAVMGTANAVINGLQTQPFVPLGIIMGALAATLGAVQISAIQSSPIPQFALGGQIYGPSHSQGGVPINAEGGEYIINKNVVKKPGMGDFLNRVNSGQVNSTTINNSLDASTIESIVQSTIAGISSIPVVNVESNSTRIQRKVNNIESKASW